VLKAAACIALFIGSGLGVGGCKSIFWPPPHDVQVLLFFLCIVFLTFGSGLAIIASIGKGEEQFKLLLRLARALGIKFDVKKLVTKKAGKGEMYGEGAT
jgi:hypothetical protein